MRRSLPSLRWFRYACVSGQCLYISSALSRYAVSLIGMSARYSTDAMTINNIDADDTAVA